MKIFWEAVALSSSRLCSPVAKNLAVGRGAAVSHSATVGGGAADLGVLPVLAISLSVNNLGSNSCRFSFSSSFGQVPPDGEGRRFKEK